MGPGAVLLALALAAAAVEAAAPPDDKLCKLCECSAANVLNCTNKGRRDLPAADSGAWPEDVVEAIFEHNDIVEVGPLPALRSLRRLSFRQNRIFRIDEAAFQNLSALEEIDLSYNNLSTDALDGDIFKGVYSPPNFLPLGNVSVLRLDSNALHALRSDALEHLPNLRVLSLAYNGLRILDVGTTNAIATLSQLEVLDLSFCYLSDLSKYLLHTPVHLRELNLTGNNFLTVPSTFQYARTLQVLRLSQNPIGELTKGSFPSSLSTVEVLELDYMDELTVIGDGALAPLRSLKELYVSHSGKLTMIDAKAFAAPDFDISTLPLQKLVLRGNALRRLDQELLDSRWLQLTYLDIQDNAWLCDCDAQWMVDSLEPIVNRTHPQLLNNIVCEDPEPLRGRPFFSLHVRHYQLRCLDADGARPDKDGMLLVGVLVGVLLAVPATLAAVLCWKRGACAWLGGASLAPTRAFYRRARSDIDDSY